MVRLKLVVVTILGLCLAFSPGAAWALGGEELVDILREEKVITVDQAEKIKKKVEKVEKKKHLDWKAYWKNGLNIETEDGKNKIKIGGRIQVDFGGIASGRRSMVDQLQAEQGNSLTGFGTEIRRARLFVEGTVYDIVQFKAEYDFADQGNGTVGIKDVWAGFTKVPWNVGHIRVGHQKEPFSLEELTSSRWLTFMERALPNIFTPSRNTGLYAFNNAFKSKRLWWGAGVFLNTNDTTGDSYTNFQNWNVTGRITGLPIYQEKGRKLLHLGFGYSHQFRNEDRFQLRYRQRPEFHITDNRPLDSQAGNAAALAATAATPAMPAVNTIINPRAVNLLNPEIALVWGPFSFQGEYIWSLVSARRDANWNNVRETGGINLALRTPNPTFQGGYAYVSYFLTGENRNYNIKSACFDRVSPKRNFDFAGGPGAWEVALRYSYLNLNSNVRSDPNAGFLNFARVGIRGGIQNDITVGLNWYPTPNTRWMFNYIYADINNRRFVPGATTANNRLVNSTNFNHGPLQIFQTRFQVDF